MGTDRRTAVDAQLASRVGDDRGVPEMAAPRLQQKWIERYPTCVVATYRGEERRVPGSETGNFEWRDVPAVMEGIERAGYKVTEALDNLKPR